MLNTAVAEAAGAFVAFAEAVVILQGSCWVWHSCWLGEVLLVTLTTLHQLLSGF